jgi:protein LTV1
MPKHKDRPFNKKNSVTFKLVHRSQQDPLIADDSAPQFVLQPSGGRQRADQSKYGIYYDDDYDYMQHLKSVNELDDEDADLMPMPQKNNKNRDKKLMLPSSLFDSAVQNSAGMLSGSALPVGPQPDWDPDIVAAMDEDFDFEDPDNQLEDDFIQQALGAESDSENERRQSAAGANEYQGESDDEDERESDIFGRSDEDDDEEDENEEKQSCFTSYSMTSSVMRRNAGLSLLDQKFETLFEKEYADETEIGPLDVDEIDGQADPNHSQLMKNLIKQRNSEHADQSFDAKAFISPNHFFEEDECEKVNSDGVDEILISEKAGGRCEERFDCQSILSTYSNLYNHPKLIYEPKVCTAGAGVSSKSESVRVRVDPKTGIPVHTNRTGLTACNLKRLDAEMPADQQQTVAAAASIAMSQLSIRPKDESAEEKRTRKSQVKELRRERRQEKKANRQAFRQEDKRLNLQSFNVSKNLSAIRLV